MVRCAGFTENGESCQAEAWAESAYCLMHDPSPTARQRHAAMSSRGGRSSHRVDSPVDLKVDVSSARAILNVLRDTAQAVADGRIDRSRANSISYMCATATAVLKVHRFEERVRRIEERLDLREPEEETA